MNRQSFKTKITWVGDEPQQYIEYDTIARWTNAHGPQERVDHWKVKTHKFLFKIEGKTYVDGEFISDWVQYK